MKLTYGFLLLLVATALFASEPPAKSRLSSVPLTAEQVAVYRAFLDTFQVESKTPINVADVTTSFQPDEGDFKSCMKGFPVSDGKFEVHQINNEFSGDQHVRLVDPKAFRIADPEDAIRNGQTVEDAVRIGFSAGLLRLSEIMFDAKHRRAAFNYSFVCGRLCGNGGSVVFELKNGRWKASKRSCGYWIS